MTILVTGAAGFIGSHLSLALMARGQDVIGIDDLNPYYDPRLKQARLDLLTAKKGFAFHKLDIADREAVAALIARHKEIEGAVHLAAQAGVRYSLEHPEAYIRANVDGHFAVIDACRRLPKLAHLVYASSSSVYGGNTKLPFSIEDRIDKPISLYAATKASNELVARCYSHLYGMKMTGLRFFTVYGPWGRPDMSAFLFTKAILEGKPITVFNNGDMKRDFTFVDDIVAGVIACLDRPPEVDMASGEVPHRLYNLGNHRAEPLMKFIAAIESATGRKAEMRFEPMQAGDVKETFADIEASRRDLGFDPKTSIEVGIPRFVQWYRDFHKV